MIRNLRWITVYGMRSWALVMMMYGWKRTFLVHNGILCVCYWISILYPLDTWLLAHPIMTLWKGLYNRGNGKMSVKNA